MKIKTIQSGSVVVGTVVAVFAAGAVVLAGGRWWGALVTAVVLFMAAYHISLWVMENFVIYKLKPMYQILFSRNVRTSELNSEYESATDLVEKIEGGLADMTEANMREITRLQRQEQYRKEYVGNVSHELKTPIFNIQGYISTLLDGAAEDPEVCTRYLQRAGKSIDRLINIVNDLDEISKLESGVVKLSPERFDVVALAREAVDAVEREAARKGTQIRVGKADAPAPQPIMVVADRRYIMQVLINLLVNSVRYGVEHGRTRISFVDLFDKVMVEVADNGIGIDKADLPRLFERFYRTDKGRSREEGGTGLGLAIVKHIIEAHGQSVTVRSELGEGTTFSFTLPKAR